MPAYQQPKTLEKQRRVALAVVGFVANPAPVPAPAPASPPPFSFLELHLSIRSCRLTSPFSVLFFPFKLAIDVTDLDSANHHVLIQCNSRRGSVGDIIGMCCTSSGGSHCTSEKLGRDGQTVILSMTWLAAVLGKWGCAIRRRGVLRGGRGCRGES